MSATFKKGDVCIVIASPCLEKDERGLIGRECTVLGICRHPLATLGMLFNPDHMLYDVDIQGFGKTPMCGNCLRKKQPPKEKGDWNLIEKITGWIPKPMQPVAA